MDWIRRNWPDLLIGLALVAVIAGIIATLLNGGTFLPFGQNNGAIQNGGSLPVTSQTAPNVSSTTPVASATNGTTPNNNAVIVVPPSIEGSPANAADTLADAAANVGDAVTDTAAAAANSVAGATDTVTDVAAGAVDTAQSAVQPVLPGANPAEAVSDAATTAANTVTDTVTANAPSASTDAATATANGAYRISVGAFGNPANAESRATTFRNANYPVFTAPQGDLTLVLVGPYDSSTQADQVAAQIRSAGLEPNPVIYALDTTAGSPASASPATTPTASSTAPESTTAVTTAAPAATGNVPATATQGSYVQVGAYGSVESSMPQRRVLEGLGFTVLHVEEQGLIKLLVGPYDASNLAAARSLLNAQGIDNIVR